MRKIPLARAIVPAGLSLEGASLTRVPDALRLDADGEQIHRLRRLCADLPGTSEKLSHGAPTFFAGKVYAIFSDNHHNNGRLAVWLPVPDGEQLVLIDEEPGIYFRPPYVGYKGWIGMELRNIDDEALAIHLQQAWRIMTKKKQS